MHGWTVHVEAAGEEAAQNIGDAVEKLADMLADYGAALGVTDEGYSVTLSIAANVSEPIPEAIRIVKEYALHAGMPAWPIVSAEAETYDQ